MVTADYRLKAATFADIETYVRCHVACLAETYVDIMPPAFFEQQRRGIAARIAEEQQQWTEVGPGASGTRLHLALDVAGATVGVARSGPGPQTWEARLGAPRAAVDLQLHHIYTLRRTHGSGLGQSLLDLAVGEHDAYLWILHGNTRAERFYRRNSFVPDGVELDCGPTWFHRSMFRMLRHGTG